MFVSSKLNSIGIILLTTTWLLDGFTKEKVRSFVKHPFFIFSALLFLCYVFGWAISVDKPAAGFAVEKKLSLVLLPAILLSMPALGKERLQRLFSLFVGSTVLLMVTALWIACARYAVWADDSVFFYHGLVECLHISAITASCFCLVSLILVFQLPIPDLPRGLLAFFLISSLLLLSSKIFLFLLVLLAMAYLFSLKGSRPKVILLSGMALGALCIWTTPNPIQKRFADMSRFSVGTIMAHRYKAEDYFDGLTMRLVFVRFSKQILQEKRAYLFGVGTGDAERHLKQKIADSDMYTGRGTTASDIGYLEYGFHNQYAQMGVQMGLVGLGLFLILLAYAWLAAVRYDEKWLAAVLLLFTIGCFTECWLEAQTGLVLFLLFALLGIRHIGQYKLGTLSH